MKPQSQQTSPPQSGRSLGWFLGALGLVAVLLLWARLHVSRGKTEDQAGAAVAQSAVSKNATHPASRPQPTEAALAAAKTSATIAPAKPSAPAALGTIPAPSALPLYRAEPTPYTQQLVSNLLRIDPPGSAPTAERAAEWKQTLQQLVQQGPTAVPAIREFLEKNVDLDFGPNANQTLGYASARAAMFDALRQIGGPEALSVVLQTLQTTADPREIALLSRNLEQQVPEQYRGDVLNAVREALNMAANKNLEGSDVGPLFEVLQKYGGAGAVTELEQAIGKWKYYAAMALAELPDGAGVPSLIRMSQDPNAGGGGARQAALEALTQVATRYPEARAALVEQVRADKIPATTWPYLAPVLVGDQFRIQDSVLDTQSAKTGGSDLRSVHIAFGNQNFYTAPTAASLSPEQITQQIQFVEELLAVASNPAAVKTLQDAKAVLQKRLPPTAAAVPSSK